MRKWFALLGLFTFQYATAQQEKLLPVEPYAELTGKDIKEHSQLLKTNHNWPEIFPVADGFDLDSPDTLFWGKLDAVNTTNGYVIFNAQTNNGSTYSGGDGSFGVIDELQTLPINSFQLPLSCYISFEYESGNTFQTGDSLVLQALNASGNWVNIWRSADEFIANTSVSLNFNNTVLFQQANFRLRLVAYASRTASNTATFKVHRFTFAPKGTFPFYENVWWNTSQQQRTQWAVMQGEQRRSNEIGWGNIINLNAYKLNNQRYAGSFLDTIQSHAFQINAFKNTDSVYFRFYFKAFTTNPTDSLILEFRNNSGLWVRQLAVSASQAQQWRSELQLINRGRLNHEQFQFRVLIRGNADAGDTLKWGVSGFHIGRKLVLPFVDDFSTTNIYPDADKWKDRLVFINNRFPIRPPSLNVATFDGLNAIGVPYGIGRSYCDTLTSWPIKLNGLVASDSVYLSFFVQPRGLGFAPDLGDTLSLFVRYTAASVDSFRLLWRSAPGSLLDNRFTLIRIPLPTDVLHDDFQLRFINKGSRTGNLNHWHLDYVYINKGRTINDAITDIAIQEDPSSLLKPFLSMPYEHFKVNPTAYLRDTQYFSVRNNSNQGYAIDYGREIFDQQMNRIDSFGTVISVFSQQSEQVAGIKKLVNLVTPFTTDSVVFHSRFYTRLGTTFDNIRSNDTIWQQTYFGNYYAYDDGTAEAGYAIQNAPGKAALRYVFAKPDTLYGMAVHFNRSKIDVSGLSFNLMVWKNISPAEEVLLRIPAKAVYFNARNGFHYVKFDQPIPVSNTVYIGWEQNQIFDLNVGFDLNYKVSDFYLPNPEMFYNVQGLWQPTGLWGALMMRPIVGKWIDPPPVGANEPIVEKIAPSFVLYPNPAQSYLNIGELQHFEPQEIGIYSSNGILQKTFYYTNQSLEISDLSPGLYFVKVSDNKQQSITKKLLITPK